MITVHTSRHFIIILPTLTPSLFAKVMELGLSLKLFQAKSLRRSFLRLSHLNWEDWCYHLHLTHPAFRKFLNNSHNSYFFIIACLYFYNFVRKDSHEEEQYWCLRKSGSLGIIIGCGIWNFKIIFMIVCVIFHRKSWIGSHAQLGAINLTDFWLPEENHGEFNHVWSFSNIESGSYWLYEQISDRESWMESYSLLEVLILT